MRRHTMMMATIGLAGLTMLCAGRTGVAAEPAFTATIDKAAHAKFGLQYPATYVFRVSGVSPQWGVRCRDSAAAPWRVLPRKTGNDFFVGIQCARIDADGSRVYVSVGFQGSNVVEIAFQGVGSAAFDSVARFYDNRKAAFTLSNDNWGCNPWAHPGAPWRGPTDDASDNYQASLHVCRGFGLPVTMAINSRMAGRDAMWRTMQEELDRRDRSWEPAVHGWTHPRDPAGYTVHGYKQEILGCRDDILKHLKNIPYGQYVNEHILTFGHADPEIQRTDAGEFLFVRGFNWLDNPLSIDYVPWNKEYRFYGIGGQNTVGYDRILERREPKGRYYAADVAELNAAFDRVYREGGLMYALWHPDRFRNRVIYDPSPGVEGQRGSTLVQHFAHVAKRNDVWYVANGWLYAYRYVAENVRVAGVQ